MKNLFFALLLSFFFVSCNGKTKEDVMLNYIHNFFKDKTYEFKINKIIPVNFTNENRNEYFVYFDEYYRKTGVSASKSKYGFMFIFDEKDKLLQAQFAPFPYMLTDDGDFFKYKVSPKIKKINEGIIYDFNGNGKEEFILFTICGSVYEFDIFEYKDGKLKLICPDNIYNYNLDYLDFETKSMYLTERPPYHEKIKLTWNPKIEFYEMEVLQE